MTDQKPKEMPTPEVKIGDREASMGDVNREAEDASTAIDKVVVDFRAEQGVDNSDEVIKADKLAETSKKEIKLILDGEEKPVNKERVVFDYSGANDWLELFSQIGKNMSLADADFVIDSIKAFREGKIKLEELPVTPDSHIKEVVLKLKKRDSILDEVSTEKEPTKVETKKTASSEKASEKAYVNLEFDPRYVNLLEKHCLVYLTTKDNSFPKDKYNGQINEDGYLLDLDNKPTLVLASQCIGEDGLLEAKKATEKEFASLYVEDYKKYHPASESEEVEKATEITHENSEAEIEVDKATEFETKFDVRDAATKGKINKLKEFLEKLNKAGHRSNDPEKNTLLAEAAIILDNPSLTKSADLGLAIDQAHIAIENKIRSLELKIRIDQLERLSVPLKDLLKEINDAKTREAKLEALKNAAQLLNKPYLGTAVFQRSKNETDLLVPDAIEMAVLLAEAKLRGISEEIAKLKSVVEPIPEPEPEPVTPETKPEPVNPEPVPTPDPIPSPEPVPTPEPVPVPTPEPVPSPVPVPTPEPVPSPEPVPTPEPSPEDIAKLTDARNQYFELVKKRKKIFSRDRKFIIGRQKDEAQDELDQAHDNYESLKQEQIIKIIEQMKANGETDPQKLVDVYINFLQNEESNVDDLAEASDKTKFNKFKEWWKRHTKARIALGAGLFAVGAGATFASGGVLGGLASAVSSSFFASTGFAAARGITSGGGTYMGLEGVIDLKSKTLGQKGLIDEVEGNNFSKYYSRKKEGDKVTVEETDISKEKKDSFEANLQQLSLQDLGAELARLRHMGLEKGVGFAEAGRQGKSQIEAAQVLEKVYYEKLRQSILASEALKTKEKDKLQSKENKQEVNVEQTPEQIAEEKTAKANRLLDVLKMKTEDERSGTLISEADKYRTKSMIRHGVAASLGIGMGVLSGVMAEKMMTAHAAKEVAKETASAAVLGATQKAVEQAEDVIVKPGDTLWKIIAGGLREKMGEQQWDALGEAGRTHAIDQVKDAIGANPKFFGLSDIDKLLPGQHIYHLESLIGQPGSIQHIQEGVQAMYAAGGEANILANNDALEAAARAGVHLTTENVDMVANEIRNFGTSFLSPDGAVHQWALNGQAVDRLADGSFVLAGSREAVSPDQLANVLNHAKESAQHFMDVESAAKATAEVAATQAVEQAKVVADAASEVLAQQQVETFLTEGGIYNHGIFETAKDLGQIDNLVTKVISSGNTEQISNFIHDYAGNMGWSPDKTNIFIGALQHGDKLDFTAAGVDLNSPQIVAENMKLFENTALNSFSKVKDMPAGHWIAAKLGDTYALVQKYHSGIWPVRSDHWLIDTNGDRATDILKLDDEAMKQALTKGINVVKKVIAESASKTPFGTRPPAM